MKEGWTVGNLDDLITFNQIGIVRNKKEQGSDKAFKYLKMDNIYNTNGFKNDKYVYVDADQEELEKYSLKNEDFLFNTRNSYELVGKTCLFISKPNEKILFNNNIMRMRFKEVLIPKFIEMAFCSKEILEQLEKMKSGTTSVVGIYYKSLRNLQIPIPPLTEQKQIVAILDQAFAAIDQAKANIEKNIQNAKELFQSKLNEIFSQKGDGWERKKLGGICERVSVGHVGATSKFYTEIGGVPFIRSQNVRRGFINLSSVRHVTKEFHAKLKKSQLKKGDILFVRVGVNRGDCATLTEEIGDLNCANIVFARPICENSKFIEYYFLSPLGTKSLLGLTTGSAQGVINTKSIEQTYINFPSEKEQEMIVKKIEFIKIKMNCIEAKYINKLESLKELKKSLLQKAFAGELTKEYSYENDLESMSIAAEPSPEYK